MQSAKPLKYAVRLKFMGSFSDLEDWLAAHCEGAYSYNFEGVHETGSLFDQLEILFRFEHKHDAEAFRDHLRVVLKRD